jgi:hypothetical protein
VLKVPRKIVERGSLGPAGRLHVFAFVRAAGQLPSASTPPSAAPPSGAPDSAEALRLLDDLRAKNLITEDEYQAKSKAIIDRL